MDPGIDFSAIWSQFDTLLMGRRTYEAATRRLGRAAFAGKATFVFSKQLEAKDHPGVTIVSALTRHWLQALKKQDGNDIWLMGGGELFRKLLDLGEVELSCSFFQKDRSAPCRSPHPFSCASHSDIP